MSSELQINCRSVGWSGDLGAFEKYSKFLVAVEVEGLCSR
jgi:hypothetical protein